MSESPWSVNRKEPPGAKPFAPQSAQVKHIPHDDPPQSPIRPRARRKDRRKLLVPRPEKNAPAAEKASPRRNRAKQAKNGMGTLAFALLGVLLVILAVSSISLIQQTSRLRALQDDREAARRQQANKVENHLRHRSQSGYQRLIDSYAAEYQISPAFVAAIIKCESNFLPRAVSSADARGLMQIMPDTGVWLAGRLGTPNYTIDRLFEPQLNIQFGAYYLAYLSSHFDGHPVMVAAAYHAGLNNVKLWAMNHAADQRTLNVNELPMSNTRDYVRKVMDAYAIYYEQDAMEKGAVPGSVSALAFMPGISR
ncbi:MAG: lytic transglycosylase domain-containing protein [Eubacteriales bacterium]|nr:lytic transglycosylase domain-containing protein [Eubacteriales bacterium]